MCLHQPRKVTDHVYVCWVYQFCLVLRFDNWYWNCSYNVVYVVVILLINLTLTLWMLLYNDSTESSLSWIYFVEIRCCNIIYADENTNTAPVFALGIVCISVSVFVLCGVDRVFKPRSVQTILCPSEAWTVVSISWHYEIPTKLVGLGNNRHHHHPIECYLFSP